MRTWPYAPDVAHLVFVDHLEVPTSEMVDAALDDARRRGASAVRTSALFPRSAEVVLAAGFRPIDELALLRRTLDDADTLPAPERRTHPLRPWQHGAAARIDLEAFGPLWGNDAASLRGIRRATPLHRARTVRARRAMAGFAISGAAADHGYLQRLAVAADHRRRGIARDLVLDALHWMHDRGLATVLVNTGVANDAALTLYEGLGFVRLPDRLTIAERRLTG